VGILGKLFRKQRQPYVAAGVRLTNDLVTTLGLTDWPNFEPDYRPDEIEAIETKLSGFQNMANEEMGGQAGFHRDIAPDITRLLAAQALNDLTARECEWPDEVPPNWRDYVSTYLKSWAALLDPFTLYKLGEFLLKAGRRNEAKRVFDVILLFPTYAETYYDGEPDLHFVNGIVSEAKKHLAEL